MKRSARPKVPLDKRSDLAIAAIEERFRSFYKTFEVDGRAWGEYLDEKTTPGQVGIYGTVAAVDVLTSAGYAADSQWLVGARRSLDLHFPSPTLRWQRKRDFDVTLKRAWLAVAESSGVDHMDAPTEHSQWLVDSQLRLSGWGVYWSNVDSSAEPELVSTCYAIIALSKWRTIARSDSYAAAVTWLANYVDRQVDPDVADVALARIAIRAAQRADAVLDPKVAVFMKETLRPLEAYARRNGRNDEVTFRRYSHSIGIGAQATEAPFSLPRQLVVGFDLLEANSYWGMRLIAPFVFSAVKHKGLPVDKGRFRTETQWWAIRAFRMLTQEKVRALAGGRALWMDAITLKRSLVFIVSIVLAVAGVIIQRPAAGSPGWRRASWVVVTVLAVIAGNVVAGMFFYFKSMKDRDGTRG